MRILSILSCASPENSKFNSYSCSISVFSLKYQRKYLLCPWLHRSSPKFFIFHNLEDLICSPVRVKNNVQSRGETVGNLFVFKSRGEPVGLNVFLELLFKVGANASEFRLVRPRSPKKLKNEKER